MPERESSDQQPLNVWSPREPAPRPARASVQRRSEQAPGRVYTNSSRPSVPQGRVSPGLPPLVDRDSSRPRPEAGLEQEPSALGQRLLLATLSFVLMTTSSALWLADRRSMESDPGASSDEPVGTNPDQIAPPGVTASLSGLQSDTEDSPTSAPITELSTTVPIPESQSTAPSVSIRDCGQFERGGTIWQMRCIGR